MNKIKTKSKWKKDLEQNIVIGLLLACSSYYLIAGTKFGENKFFYGARESMKSTLMKEYIMSAEVRDLKEHHRLPSVEDLAEDVILKAIQDYQGPVNYTCFRDYIRTLGLEEGYYTTVSKHLFMLYF